MDATGSDFARFVETRESALRRTAWLLTGDWGLAEDLVQTALARSWPRWERITRRDNPEAYVRRRGLDDSPLGDRARQVTVPAK